MDPLRNDANSQRDAPSAHAGRVWTMKVPSDHLRSFVDHDGAVILDISRDQFFSLNTVGAYIWKRINEGNTVEQIAQSLAKDTGAEVSAILSDIDEFVTDLTTRHLL
jgi:hypothetical protein